MERRLKMDSRIRLGKLLNSPEIIKDDAIKAKLVKIIDKINHSDITSWEYNLEGTLFIHITDEVIDRIGIIAYYDNLREIIEGIYFKTSIYRFKTIHLIIDFNDLEYNNLYTEVILYSLKEIIDCLYSQVKLFTLKIELVCPELLKMLTQECVDIVDYLVIPITKQSSFDYSELDASYPSSLVQSGTGYQILKSISSNKLLGATLVAGTGLTISETDGETIDGLVTKRLTINGGSSTWDSITSKPTWVGYMPTTPLTGLSNKLLGVNATETGYEYKSFDASTISYHNVTYNTVEKALDKLFMFQ